MIRIHPRPERRSAERGSILLISFILIMVMMGLLLVYFSNSLSNSREQNRNESSAGAMYVAEAALAGAFRDLNTQARALAPGALSADTTVGANATPVKMTVDGVSYEYTTSVKNVTLGTSLYKVVKADVQFVDPSANGVTATRSLEMTLYDAGATVGEPHKLYSFAIFAGLRDDGLAQGYEMNFGGQSGNQCSTCKGTGTDSCKTCGGDGKITCTNKKSSCSKCKGKGWYTCTVCPGASGSVTCSKCSGSGKIGGNHADLVNGKIYSGGDIKCAGNSEINNLDEEDSIAAIACGKISGNPMSDKGDKNKGDVLENDLANALPPPDLKQMHYNKPRADETGDGVVDENDWHGHDYDVADTLATKGVSGSWTNNGTAEKQIKDANEPCHIFRLNPDDRKGDAASGVASPSSSNPAHWNPNSGWAATGKKDYFLEDPTVSSSTVTSYSGASATGSCAASYPVKMAPNTENKVFFVNGNLWIHNKNAYDMMMRDANGNGAKTTIVVQGNIYISDNIRYKYNDPDAAVALVAVGSGETYTDSNNNGKYDAGEALVNDDGDGVYDGDANKPPGWQTESYNDLDGDRKYTAGVDTLINDDGDGVYEGPPEGQGNIFFGDPVFGTLEQMDSFMYADNNFCDTNLDEAGSVAVTLNGNMTAGNRVDIKRDHSGGSHSRLLVNFDERIKDGDLNLRGLPPANLGAPAAGTSSGYTIKCRREL